MIKDALRMLFPNNSIKDKFTRIYRNNSFLGKESRSGEGSSLVQTQVIRRQLPELLKELDVKTLIDAPCGDFFWMKEVDLPVDQYIGLDIVDEIIAQNNNLFGNTQRTFMVLDITKDNIPKADMILCRDCLVHLSFEHCMKAIHNFKKSGTRYLLTTSFFDRASNSDLGGGFWRPLNLEIPPFNFPKPLSVINENCTECDGSFSDKTLGLWLLEHINISFE